MGAYARIELDDIDAVILILLQDRANCLRVIHIDFGRQRIRRRLSHRLSMNRVVPSGG